MRYLKVLSIACLFALFATPANGQHFGHVTVSSTAQTSQSPDFQVGVMGSYDLTESVGVGMHAEYSPYQQAAYVTSSYRLSKGSVDYDAVAGIGAGRTTSRSALTRTLNVTYPASGLVGLRITDGTSIFAGAKYLSPLDLNGFSIESSEWRATIGIGVPF